MDENKKEQFNRIDELLKDTSAENRIKFNEDEAIDILSEQEDKPAELEEAVVSGIEANPIAEDEHNDEDSSDSVCIIDETSTTLELIRISLTVRLSRSTGKRLNSMPCRLF